MDKFKFNYSVIRFVPEKTLEEFVNIGIILKCNDTNFLGIRAQQWTQRVSHFFKYVDRSFYLSAVKSLTAEVRNIKKRIGNQSNDISLLRDDLDGIFSSIVKPLDSAIQFSPVYSGITNDLEAELDYLHGKYVLTHIQGPDMRERITKEQIEREIHNTLKKEKLTRAFKEQELKCKVFSQRFAYVHKNGGAPEIIHPLSFDFDDEIYLSDTAYKWCGRLKDLRKDNKFRITMIVAPPKEKYESHFNHAKELLLDKHVDEIILLRELDDFGKRLKQKIKV